MCHNAELGTTWRTEGRDPPVVHNDIQPENSRVLLGCNADIHHRQDGDGSFNSTAKTVLPVDVDV